MVTIKDLFKILAHQETPEEMEKARLEELLDESEKYSLEIEKNPEDEEAYFNRGVVRSSLGLLEEAIDDWNEAIKLNPDYSEAYFVRGLLNQHLGRYEEAIKSFDKLIEQLPTSLVLCCRGSVKAEQKQIKNALEDFDEALKLTPGYLPAIGSKGIIKITELGKLDEGIADLDKVIEAIEKSQNQEDLEDINARAAYFMRGLARKQKGLQELAIQDLKKAIALGPISHYDILEFASADHKIDGVLLEKITQIIPNPATYTARSMAILNPLFGIKYSNKAIELNPKYAYAYFTRGVRKAQLEKYQEAKEDFDKAIELNITEKAVYKKRAEIHEKLGMEELAQKDREMYEKLNRKV